MTHSKNDSLYKIEQILKSDYPKLEQQINSNPSSNSSDLLKKMNNLQNEMLNLLIQDIQKTSSEIDSLDNFTKKRKRKK